MNSPLPRSVPSLSAGRWLLLGLAAALALGCGPKPEAEEPAPEVAAAPAADAEQPPAEPDSASPGAEAEATPGEAGFAPPPFTAEQIRDATPSGRSYRYAIQENGAPATVEIVFTEVGPEDAVMERRTLDASGAVVDSATERATWAELVGHASYPSEVTEISDATITTPAGTYDCLLYKVTNVQQGQTLVSNVYFARALPGAPVKMDVTLDGQPVFAMELVAHSK